MPTNEERREIAEKVRNARTTKSTNVSFEKLAPIEFMCEIAKAIGFGKQEDGSFIDPSYSEFADRIADIIEPKTCRAVKFEEEEFGGECAYTCSECGELLVKFDFESKPYKPTGYCPGCGAKVIEESEKSS